MAKQLTQIDTEDKPPYVTTEYAPTSWMDAAQAVPGEPIVPAPQEEELRFTGTDGHFVTRNPKGRKGKNPSNVGQTVLEQLGGRQFSTMTGAHTFTASATSLTFKLPARFAKDGINAVTITLTGGDDYDLVFYRIRGTSVKVVAERKGVQVSGLRRAFTDVTGLDTSLGTLGRNPTQANPKLFKGNRIRITKDATDKGVQLHGLTGDITSMKREGNILWVTFHPDGWSKDQRFTVRATTGSVEPIGRRNPTTQDGFQITRQSPPRGPRSSPQRPGDSAGFAAATVPGRNTSAGRGDTSRGPEPPRPAGMPRSSPQHPGGGAGYLDPQGNHAAGGGDTSRNPSGAMGKTYSRAKSRFKSARAAWGDIEDATGVSPSEYNLKRMDTADRYRWKVMSRKGSSNPGTNPRGHGRAQRGRNPSAVPVTPTTPRTTANTRRSTPQRPGDSAGYADIPSFHGSGTNANARNRDNTDSNIESTLAMAESRGPTDTLLTNPGKGPSGPGTPRPGVGNLRAGPIHHIIGAGITHYRDSGQRIAWITFLDAKGKTGTTSGDPDNTHMKALLDRARREGITVRTRRANPQSAEEKARRSSRRQTKATRGKRAKRNPEGDDMTKGKCNVCGAINLIPAGMSGGLCGNCKEAVSVAP